MELILDIFWEERRVYVEWKQIICAVLLAFLIAGLYNYISAQSDYAEEFAKEQAVPAENLPAIGTFESILLLPEEDIEEAGRRLKSEGIREAVVKEPNFAVSRGHSEPEAENRTKRAKPVEKTTMKEVNSDAVKESDNRIKYVTAAPDIPVTDVITEIPDIVTGGKDDDAGTGNEKAESGDANTNKIEDTNKTESDSAGADRTETDTPDTDKAGNKPAVLVERFPGFLINEEGHIAGYTDASKILKDYLVVFPRNAACTGIEKDALKGLETDIYEIYLPANISYIAEGALDDLVNLHYIEAAPGNPRFYSENGILYYRNGEVAVCPNRLKR